MKLFLTKTIQVLSILMLMVYAGAFLTSCKNEQKSKSDKEQPKNAIDKTAAAQIGFYETYQYNDIHQYITKLSKAAGDPIMIKNIPTYGEIPCVCYATQSDTAAINAIIEKYGKDILPADLKLMWTQKPENDYFNLVALKTDASGKPAMTGESIIEAEVTEQEYNGYVTGIAISIALDEEGGKQFSRLTAQNINRAVAVVYKDKVYSYPTVHSQIDGGRLQITGKFTEEEANDLVNVLYGKK